MSNETHFRFRRFVDLDTNGNEIEDKNNYGYSIFNSATEIISVGMSKVEILDMQHSAVERVVSIIQGIDSDFDRSSFLNSIDRCNGLYINGVWQEIGLGACSG